MIEYIKIEKKPKKGLLAFEWAMLAYMAFTLVLIFFTYTKLKNPDAMLFGRMRIVAMTAAMWFVYRLVPCRLTRFLRVLVQVSLLAWWYPDTYELNRSLPNLDHLFATWEQNVFHCQPALLFSQWLPQPFFSELMDLGYASYYPLIAVVLLYYYIYRYKEFEHASFVVLASFFAYYVIYDLLPVVGPQYYYGSIGFDQVAKGAFPAVGDYFNTHADRIVSPGWTDGFFYQMVENAHNAGERPTAAFPSSHVGCTMVILLLAWHSKNRRLLYSVVPFFVLMFFATVYIQAHYAIDAIAGIVTGILFYFMFFYAYKVWKPAK